MIQLQPDERISLRMMTKSPGKGMRLEPVDLNLNLAQVFGQTRRWDAYERLLLDILEGDSTLFMRRDEVEAAWAWIDPILKAGKNTSRRHATIRLATTVRSRPTACWPTAEEPGIAEAVPDFSLACAR